VLEAFTWNGVAFPSGAWVLLDLYGTNHDARIWTRPNELMPDRLLAREPTPFEFVPQGAGETSQTHRCPGERLTTELIKVAVRMLSAMTYTVPLQDLSVDLSVIPALPKSGFVLTEVRPA